MHKTRNVTFNIPAGDQYEINTISSFSGLNITDNPLLADQTEAADILNLYLTAENTLATRPRLELQAVENDCKRMISAWKLDEKLFLFHYINENDNIVIKVKKDGVLTTINLNNNTVGNKKIRCFKKDEKIYLLTEHNYYLIEDNTLRKVVNDGDTYVPITSIDTLVDGVPIGVSNESLNSLTNKYKHKVYWDGEQSLYNKLSDDYVSIENNYYKQINIPNITGVAGTSNSGDFVIVTHNLFEIITAQNNTIETNISNNDYECISVSDNGKFVVFLKLDGTGELQIFDSIYKSTTSLTPANINTAVLCHIDDSGSLLYLYSIEDFSNEKHTIKIYSKTNNVWSEHKTLQITTPYSSITSADCKCFVVGDKIFFIERGGYLHIINLSSDEVSTTKLNYQDINPIVHNLQISNDGKKLIGYSGNRLIVLDIEDVSKMKSFYLEYSIHSSWCGSDCFYFINSIGDLCFLDLNHLDKIKLLLKIPEVSITNTYYISRTNVIVFANSSDAILLLYEESIEPKLTIYYNKKEDKEIKSFTIETELPITIDTSKMTFVKNMLINVDGFIINKDLTNYNTIYSYGYIFDSVYIPLRGYIEFTKMSNNELKLTYRGVGGDIDVVQIDLKYEIFTQSTTFTNSINFYNNYWFSAGNKLYTSHKNNPTYIPEDSFSVIGDDKPITGFNLLGDTALCVYKEDKQFIITVNVGEEGFTDYYITEMKTDKGNIPFGETILSAQNNYPLQIDNDGVYVLQIPKNVNTTENSAISISKKIDSKFISEPYKENVITHNHLYWTYIMFPEMDKTKIYVLDSRNNGWYYWEIPIKVVGCWETVKLYDIVENIDGETIGIYDHSKPWNLSYRELIGRDSNNEPVYNLITYDRDDIGEYMQKQYTETVFVDERGSIYEFKTIDYIDTETDSGTEFYDLILINDELENSPINWKWESEILPMTISKYNKGYSAMTYLKQLTETGFMFVDSDKTEEYSLNYKYTIYTKKMRERNEKELPSGTLNYIRSVIKRTRIPKFNFIKITLSNTEGYRNKLNLISLRFKYKIMEDRAR